MDPATEFYLKKYGTDGNQSWTIREAKGFSRWWSLFFARTANPNEYNLDLAAKAWRDARSYSV